MSASASHQLLREPCANFWGEAFCFPGHWLLIFAMTLTFVLKGPLVAPSLSSTSGTSPHKLTAYARQGQWWQQEGLSCFHPPSMPRLILLLFSLYAVSWLSGEPVCPLLPFIKGGGPKVPRRALERTSFSCLCESRCVCRLGARTDRLPSLLCQILG